MSVADLKEYGKRAATDPVVRQKAKEIGLQNLAGQAEYAKTLGLNFDAADMQALLKEVQPKGELSEEQLANVAGGIASATAMAVASVVGTGIAVGTTVTSVTSSTGGRGW